MARFTGDMASSAEVGPRARTVAMRAASSSWLEFLERVGYVTRGVLYVVMGSPRARPGVGHRRHGNRPIGDPGHPRRRASRQGRAARLRHRTRRVLVMGAR